MTYHIHLKNYKCPNCEAIYVPFKDDITCPKCGSSDRHNIQYNNFIDEILSSMIANKKEYGFYNPPAWFSGCIAESLQSLCFVLFDTLEEINPQSPVTLFEEILATVGFEHPYQKKHAQDVAMAVYKKYEDAGILRNKPSLWTRFYKTVKSYMP